MIAPIAICGIALVIGLAASSMLWAKWANAKMVDVEARNLYQLNQRNRRFYAALGEHYYPHRNPDGTTCHFPAAF